MHDDDDDETAEEIPEGEDNDNYFYDGDDHDDEYGGDYEGDKDGYGDYDGDNDGYDDCADYDDGYNYDDGDYSDDQTSYGNDYDDSDSRESDEIEHSLKLPTLQTNTFKISSYSPTSYTSSFSQISIFKILSSYTSSSILNIQHRIWDRGRHTDYIFFFKNNYNLHISDRLLL